MHDPRLDDAKIDLNTIYKKDAEGNIIEEHPWEPTQGNTANLVVMDEVPEPAFVDLPQDKDGNLIDMQKVVDAVPLMQRISAAMEELVVEFDQLIKNADDFGKAMAIVMVKYELEVKDVSSYTYLDYVEYMASQKYVDKETRENPFVEFRKGVKQWDDTMKEWSVLAERDARIQKKEALEKQQREWIQNAIDNPDQVKGPMPNRADRRRAAKARKKGNN